MANINSVVKKILEGVSVREAMMQATIKDPATGKYVDVDFENPWEKGSGNNGSIIALPKITEDAIIDCVENFITKNFSNYMGNSADFTTYDGGNVAGRYIVVTFAVENNRFPFNPWPHIRVSYYIKGDQLVFKVRGELNESDILDSHYNIDDDKDSEIFYEIYSDAVRIFTLPLFNYDSIVQFKKDFSKKLEESKVADDLKALCDRYYDAEARIINMK